MRARSKTDSVLVAATIAFAFLAASFAAANSDLWMHLAAGRLIASGGYSFGTDPFSYLSHGRYWANHAWLFDLALYESFQVGGGAALVGLKAVGVALLAAAMLRLALKGGGPVWLSTGSVLLAVLAMSPRLLVQPQCLSLLLLAVCLSLLVAGGRALRWVPPLIVLWVNVDAWFVLGVASVVIFVVANRLRPPALPSADFGSRLIVMTLFACLINPHHVRAIALPPELSPEVWSLRDDPRFAGFFAHPWRLGTGLAAWAFPVLLATSALSFVLNRSAVRSWRLAVWLPFAALAAWQARLVPFFAVVAGPILAMNLGEVLGPNFLQRIGRRGTLLVAAFLCVLAWPGWLQSFHARDRALAWQLAPDPSLFRAAERVRERNDSAVGGSSPDVAHHLAWFAPGVHGGIDSRLQLFTGPALTIAPPSLAIVPAGEVQSEDWIVEVVGRYVLIDRRNATPRFDADRLAFTPVLPPAPEGGPAALNEPADWWNLAAHRQAPHTWEGESATAFLMLFGQQRGAERSPALPLLSIRSARTSLAVQPRGDEAWTALALAYRQQTRNTWEAAATTDFTLVKYLRHVQMAGALQQAVLANPNNATAHELLVEAFASRGFLDLALHHRREQLRIAKRGSPSEEYLARLQESIDSLERSVFEAENRFRIHSDELSGKPLERARIARELGLGTTALDSLVRSHPDLYGIEGLRLLLDLLLQLGRLPEARVLLDRDELKNNPAALDLFVLPGGTKNGREWRYRLPAYNWFDFCQHAAAGRYDRAEAMLERLRNQLFAVQSESMPQVRGVYLRAALSELGTPTWMNRATVQGEREVWAANVAQTQFLASVRGDLHALGGLLHLERGAVREAEEDFQQALKRYAENAGPAAVHPGRPLAVRYREALRHP